MDSPPKRSEEGQCELSAFERIPKELVFSIIEFAPEAVNDMRLTSRHLGTVVDEYASLRVNIPLVNELSFTYTGWKVIDDVTALVPKKRANLFELRLKLRNIQASRSFQALDNHPNVYKLRFNWTEKSWSKAEMECLGTKIRNISIFNFVGDHFAALVKQVDGVEFSKLTYSTRVMNETDSQQLLNFVKSGRFDHLSLGVGDSRDTNTEQMLLETSSLVRSLHLWQRHSANLKFIIRGPDWPRIILDMFARKLDALCIENRVDRRSQHFLPADSTAVLIDHLPQTGKPIWFESSFGRDFIHPGTQGFRINVNGHIVEGDNRNGTLGGCEYLETLSIKHATRLDETHRDF